MTAGGLAVPVTLTRPEHDPVRAPATVSVIIPAFNAGQDVARAIESVLAQTLPVLEILVVDDGSHDDTVDVASAFGHPVRVLTKPNGGPPSARNMGAGEAKGDWLAMLDADDWWFSYKNEVQFASLNDATIVLSHCLFDHRIKRPPASLTFDDLWERNWIGNSSVMIRRPVFEALGGFNEEPALISVEDYNLWLRVAAAGHRIDTCPHILAHYAQGSGISSNLGRLMKASLFNLDDLATRLDLPTDMVETKRHHLRIQFGRQALYERKFDTARTLLREEWRHEPTIRNTLDLAIASLPAPLVGLKRVLAWLPGGDPHVADGPEADTAASNGFARHPIPVGEQPFWATSGHGASIIDQRSRVPADSDTLTRPMLITTVDAEEDFEWNRPFVRGAVNVTSLRSQHKAHRVFERFGVIPTYLVDYPVASQAEGQAPLRELLRDGCCEVGAQLHPWVTPPFLEVISARNSYPGNLPLVLELAKASVLTRTLQDAFGTSPEIYRAGRCGVGPNTGEILKRLGYKADTSVMPHWNYVPQGGPDFGRFSAWPYWIDRDRSILEIPISVAVAGHAAGLPARVIRHILGSISERSGVISPLSRLGLLERIRLTPEGITINEAKRLVRHMARLGHRVFVLTYHSPSLVPGNTPYVKTKDDLDRFLIWLEEFYDFFTTEIGGVCASWRDVRSALARPRGSAIA